MRMGISSLLLRLAPIAIVLTLLFPFPGLSCRAEGRLSSQADDFSVTLSTPPFVRFGDTFLARLTIYNHRDVELTFNLTAIVEGLALRSDAAQQTRVPAESEREVEWEMTTAAASVAHVTVQVAAADTPAENPSQDGDKEPNVSAVCEATLSVLPGGAQQRLEQRGRLWVREWLVSHLNYRAEQVNSLLWISPSVLAMLLKDYRQWAEMPCQNNLQAANLLLVTSALWQALTQADASEVSEMDSIRGDLNRAAEYLLARQNPDGGWGWWPGDVSRPLHTAQVLHALFEAEGTNMVDMRESQEALGLKALHRYWESVADMDLQAYFLYVMSRGRGEGTNLDAYKLWWDRRKLSTPGLAYLGLALDNLNALPEHRRADLLTMLELRASHTEHFVWWPTPVGRGDVPGGDRYGTAVALQALLRWAPTAEPVGRSLDWLLRTDSSPGEVIDFAAAQVFVTLARARQSQEPLSKGIVRVALEGVPVFEGAVNNRDLLKVHEIVLQDLRPGSNWIEILLEWLGPLYFDWTLDYILSDGELDEARSADGIKLRRTYLDIDSDKPASSFKVGQFVLTKLEARTDNPGYDVVIEDALPAGLRAVVGSLKVDGLEHSDLELGVHGDVARFYLTELPAGDHTFTYLQRAETPGRFLAMPATAYLLHDPARWGQSAGAEITVRRRN